MFDCYNSYIFNVPSHFLNGTPIYLESFVCFQLYGINYFYQIQNDFHPVKWFQILQILTVLINDNNLFAHNYIGSLILIHYKWFTNRSISPIDGIVSGTVTSGQCGPGSNGNKREPL